MCADGTQRTSARHGVMQCVAVYCSAVQCVAVWCSAVQCGAVYRSVVLTELNGRQQERVCCSVL